MSELRQDPTTREWVIMAPERARRPQQTLKRKSTEVFPDWDKSCPFCPGNEEQTPSKVFSIPSSNEDSGWDVKVVPNKFAALSMELGKPQTEEGRLTRGMDGFGVHEVIIESPSHNTTMALMTYQQVEKILTAYQQRYNTLKRNKRLKFVTIFKNNGRGSGTSLAHPHSQLVATPIMTPYFHKRFDIAVDYYADTGRCLYCDILVGEIERKDRIIAETKQFVIFNPYASRVSYETWIIPKEHSSSFGLFPASGLSELSIALKDTLFCLYSELDDPAYNLMVANTITEDEDNPYYHWHIRVVPRLSMIAGFEIGSSIYMNSTLPEDAAQIMRQCCISYLKEGKACLTPPTPLPTSNTE
ncbi:galactose-1-phosphate uridylyltransferase [Chloroflexota bacterium]